VRRPPRAVLIVLELWGCQRRIAVCRERRAGEAERAQRHAAGPATDERTDGSTVRSHVQSTSAICFGNIRAITSEPEHIKRRDTRVPLVPLQQKPSEDVLVAVPSRGEIGIFTHLLPRQFKSFCNACNIARAQGPTAIASHQLLSSWVDGNPLHKAQYIFA
jgi:hypothetical protein